MFDLTQVEALREDLSDKAEVAERFFKMGYPINMINERMEIGFEPVEWGDVGYLPSTLVPITGDPTKEEPEPEPDGDQESPDDDEGDSEGDGDGGETPDDGAEEEPPEDGEGSEDSEEESRPGLTRPPIGLQFKGPIDSKDKRDEKWVDIYERVMRPGEKKIKRFVRALMVRIRAAALAAVGDVEGVEKISDIEEILFNPHPFKNQLHKGIIPILEEIFELATAEAEEELVEIGLVKLEDFEPIRARQLDEFDFEISQIITSQAEAIEKVVDTVRGIVTKSLDTGIAGGMTKAQLKNVIRGKFKIFSGSFWTGRIAGTESALTTSAARELTFRRRQVPSNLWVNAGDDRIRDNHVTLDDGVPRPLGFNFGKLLSGVAVLEFPLDPRAPADETINCRCALIPSQAPPRAAPNRFEGKSDREIIDLPSTAYPAVRPQATESLDMYSSEGKFTPERQILHNSIVRENIKGFTKVKTPKVTILGGGPASGKSTAAKAANISKNTVTIDADEIRTKLPEQREGIAAKNSKIAAFTHEESSFLSKRVMKEAREFDILLDGTGDGSFESLSNKINGFRSRGATTISGQYVTIDTDEAVRRMKKRGGRTGRFVPEAYMRGVHKNISQVLPKAINDGLFDELTLWDNNGAKPFIIATAKGTQLNILDQNAWERFLAKATE
jgi:predicted ABC-type ATPase